jgi:hypothetical protein
MNPHGLKRLRKKKDTVITFTVHRTKRGIPLFLLFLDLDRRGIPRFARNDGLGDFFPQRLKPVLPGSLK